MHPFIFFAIILIAIWILSSIASAISKQQDAARRRQVRQEIDPLRQQQLQQLNPGYQVRHPEMMASRPQPRAVMPARPIPVMPKRPQQQPQSQQRRRPPQRRGPALPPPIPAMQGSAPRGGGTTTATGPPKPAPAKPTPPMQAVKAPAIARWLNPATLRQQFILTEVFQPPLAMRDERLS